MPVSMGDVTKNCPERQLSEEQVVAEMDRHLDTMYQECVVSEYKRGGKLDRITLDEGLIGDRSRAVDAVALDDVLRRLEQLDPDLARLVEMRFFGGLKHPAIAELLGRSLRRVERDWRLARSWLRIELER